MLRFQGSLSIDQDPVARSFLRIVPTKWNVHPSANG
jgi:hypothetical protein